MSEYMKWKGWQHTDFAANIPALNLYYNAEFHRVRKSIGGKDIKDILEVGYGNGNFLRYCHEQGRIVSGLEADVDLVNIAKDSGYNCFHWNDRQALVGSKFDAVFAFDLIEHLTEDDLKVFFEFVISVTHLNSVLLVRNPNGDSPFSLKLQNGDLTHVRHIGSGMLRQLASRHGFKEVIFFKPCEPCPIQNLRNFIYYKLRSLIRDSLNFFLNLIYSPHEKTYYMSPNLVAIFIRESE